MFESSASHRHAVGWLLVGAIGVGTGAAAASEPHEWIRPLAAHPPRAR